MKKQVLILGGGESGRGVALLAKAKGFTVFLSDAGSLNEIAKQELIDHQIAFEDGGHSANVLSQVDLIVKSPGIPWSAKLIVKAKNKGIPVVGEMEFCAPYKRGKLIGITGSNGKTTTTLLTHHLIQSVGLNYVVGGNLGTSYARLLVDNPTAEGYVLELSSFQLEDIETFKVDIGMVLNLSPDHLDRYEGSFEAYALAKYRLLKTMDQNSLWLQSKAEVDEKYANITLNQRQGYPRIIYLPSHFQNGIALTQNQSYDLKQTALSGPHNAQNASFALTVGEQLGIEPKQLQEALYTFVNAPHRLEVIGQIKGVHLINDSKATNIDATRKALESFESIVWIVGGEDKGNDYQEILPLVKQNVKAIVAMGMDNTKLSHAFGFYQAKYLDTNSISEAIDSALKLAKVGDTILLSPACASFDLFKNYVDRGNQFKELLKLKPGFSAHHPRSNQL